VAYVSRLVDVFREVRRVLRDDGTLWLNLGDSYAGASAGGHRPGVVPGEGGDQAGARNRNGVPRVAGLKPKDLVGIPWRVAFALQADGWYLRSDIIWAKSNPMPESVTDRPTKAHEYLFLLAKGERYHYDVDAVREPWADERMGASGAQALPYSDGSGRRDTLGSDERRGLGVAPPVPGRNRRTVWTVATQPFDGAHFATFPPKLIEPCILAGCPVGGTVLDPFNGAGTTGLVAVNHGRQYVGIELNPTYAAMAEARIREGTAQQSLFHVGAA
jgi:DNA modification methylase